MGLRRRGAAADEEDIELNMTPMLDVVFILLIFFIVTAVFVKEPGIEVERPLVSQQDELNPTIIIAVSSDDEIWINKKVIELGAVRQEVEKLKAESPKAEAVIQGDGESKNGLTLDIIEIVQELEIPVFVSTDQR
ncbi:MAG: ExbD/TolR family protein [Maricaulaceae bacterium]